MTTWDPDGAGPAPAAVVVAGRFTIAGNVLANQIALWDPAAGTWTSMGLGIDGSVAALTTAANGDLVVGGGFVTVGGLVMSGTARWDGTSWSSLGPGPGNGVLALATLPGGDIVAGGSFGLRSWNGSVWSTFGNVSAQGTVRALELLPNGDLVAGGNFSSIGGVIVNGIARWNGTSWSALGSGLNSTSERIFAVTALANGDVVVGGDFTMIGGQAIPGVARWNGASWSAMGAGGSNVKALLTMPSGDVVAGGSFATAGGNIARWNGTMWLGVGGGVNTEVQSLLTLPNGDLIAGGSFARAGRVAANRIARWNGLEWSAVAPGINNAVSALTSLPNGDIIAGGTFTAAGSVPANRIARWDGNAWSVLSGGVSDGVGGSVRALVTLPNGDVVVGGRFTAASAVAANNIARWNGSAWSTLGSGVNGEVSALCSLPNGDLLVGGTFTSAGGVAASRIARWNGTAWSPLGAGVSGTGSVNVAAIAALPNSDIVVGGQFTTAGAAAAALVARWNGTSWSPLGSGMTGPTVPVVLALATLPNGEIVAGGRFTVAGGVAASNIARWNGATWSPLAGGINATVSALLTLPNGDVMAAGWFSAAGLVAANSIARWNGTAWSAVGQGLDQSAAALTMGVHGALVVGGTFTRADNRVSAHLAFLASTCPATAAAFGSGCSGSGGANALDATTLPWTGSTFRAAATGMPANAVAVAVYGFGTGSTPLQSILPQGMPGCSLLVSPDLLLIHLPNSGVVATSLAIPSNVALAGQVLHHQVVPFEFDLAGSLSALTSTNALTVAVGTF